MREIIATGKDTEQAIEAGLLELNVSREDVKIEILETSNKGLFGLFGALLCGLCILLSGCFGCRLLLLLLLSLHACIDLLKSSVDDLFTHALALALLSVGLLFGGCAASVALFCHIFLIFSVCARKFSFLIAHKSRALLRGGITTPARIKSSRVQFVFL